MTNYLPRRRRACHLIYPEALFLYEGDDNSNAVFIIRHLDMLSVIDERACQFIIIASHRAAIET